MRFVCFYSSFRRRGFLLVGLGLLLTSCSQAPTPIREQVALFPAQEVEVAPTIQPTVRFPLSASSTAPKHLNLWPGDLLRVQVYDHTDLSVDLRVSSSGQVNFPLIGLIENVVGMSVDTFRETLRKRLENGFIRQAVITLAVVEYGPRQVYVMGCVENKFSGKSGTVELNPFTPLTALQAISQVGGLAKDANRTFARVIRINPENPNERISLPIPTKDDAESLQKDIELQPGDMITVPALDRVYVLGKVKNAGPLNLPTEEKLTVSKAISVAGGFDRYARDDEVQLIHLGKSISVPVKQILNGNTNLVDPVLQPGDTVFVRESQW